MGALEGTTEKQQQEHGILMLIFPRRASWQTQELNSLASCSAMSEIWPVGRGQVHRFLRDS